MSISWTLLKKSGRQSFARLGLTAMAIAIGVMLIGYFTAGVNGLLGLGHRTDHLSKLVGAKQEPIPGVKPARINRPYRGNITDWHGRSIEQLKIYSTAETFKFPELKVMQPGEYYLSPALKKVIDEHPTDDILARFGRFNKYLGTVPEKYLVSPDSLVIISGVDAKEVKEHEEHYSKIYRSGFDDNGTSYDAASIVVLSVGGAILLFPIIVFVSVATQLGATQREKRYAALRLIGATKRQVNRILILESLLASAVGIAIGFIGFWSLQAPLLNFRIDGERMWPSDMQPSVLQHLVIIALTLGLTAFINWRRMRRAQISPLGVSHTLEKVKKLRIWRVIILAIGLGLFAWLSTKDGRQWIRKDSSGAASSLVFVGAFLTIMLGLVLSGSWLTNKIALLCVRLSDNASVLIAGKRTAVHSRAIFRSVCGVVLALFAGSFYLTSVSGMERLSFQTIKDNGYSQLRDNTVIITSGALPDQFAGRLAKLPYISSVATFYSLEDEAGTDAVRCRDLTKYTDKTCPAGAKPDQFASINFMKPVVKQVPLAKSVDTTKTKQYLATITAQDHIEELRTFVVANTGTDGDDTSYITSGHISKQPRINPTIKSLAGLAYAGIGVTLFVAIASLIVSTIGGLIERRRSLYTLRLSGMRLVQLKRLIMIESVTPLLLTSIVSCIIGVWTGSVFIGIYSTTLHPTLTPTYFGIVGGGLLVAIVGIYLLLPMVDQLTRADANQTE